jgi:putative effector of murein hydrolase LrgA (UPF0299 family)
MNEALRARIAADLTPVRPLPTPLQRTVALVPFAVMLLVAAPFVFTFRDLAPLGWTWSWAASIAQSVVGLAVITLALRKAVPGREWTASATGALIIGVLVLFVAVTYATWAASPVDAPRRWWLVVAICAVSSATSALPVVALVAALVVRAYPLRPLATGAIAGFGAGLIADAGWRLFCHYSEPAHVLSAHFGGVLLASAVGAMLVRALWRIR